MDDDPEIIVLKNDYIAKINDLLTKCHDLNLIDFIFKILKKSV